VWSLEETTAMASLMAHRTFDDIAGRCPYCEKVTDDRVLIRRFPGVDVNERLEPADPPLGVKHAATCLSCFLLHSCGQESCRAETPVKA
jgi:hypothetical protein